MSIFDVEFYLVWTLLSGTLMNSSDKKPLPCEISVPEQHTENLLLERLNNSKSEDDYFRWMLFVVGYYRGINKVEAAVTLLADFLNKSGNQEQKAHCQLALGQIATDGRRLEAALNHFEAALNLAPRRKKVAYVLHNNTGYCLNLLGRYSEGEKHCRMAIEINWKRASGYRNLGVSRQGQGDLLGAAWALVEASKADGADCRARALLEKLITDHPGIVVQCPWIAQGLYQDAKAASDIVLV